MVPPQQNRLLPILVSLVFAALLLVARGDVVRAGLSMVFVRGIIYDADDAASNGKRPASSGGGVRREVEARLLVVE